MSKKIALSIAEPCHENWDNMNAVDRARPDGSFRRGRFCGSCQKQVVDFSNLSDQQVAEFFKKPSTGSVCGRFMTDQLNREIDIPRKRIPWIKYFFSIFLPAIFISKLSAQDIMMGKVLPPQRDTVRTPLLNEVKTLGMVISNSIEPEIIGDTTIVENLITDTKKVKGKIIDENGVPIPFAHIQFGKPAIIFMADRKGEFAINLKSLGENKSLFISSVGFESKEVFINNASAISTISLASFLMGDVEVTSSNGFLIDEIVAGRVSSVELDTSMVVDEIMERDIPLPTVRNKFFIYPNPILSGGNIALGFSLIEGGLYNVSFVSLSGQLIQQKEIWIDESAIVLNMEVPKVATGSYFMVLTNKKTKKKMTEKVLIQ